MRCSHQLLGILRVKGLLRRWFNSPSWSRLTPCRPCPSLTEGSPRAGAESDVSVLMPGPGLAQRRQERASPGPTSRVLTRCQVLPPATPRPCPLRQLSSSPSALVVGQDTQQRLGPELGFRSLEEYQDWSQDAGPEFSAHGVKSW